MLLSTNRRLPFLFATTATTTTITIALTLLLLVISESLAFQCYVCDSKSDIDCVEKLPDDTRLRPQSCQNITGAKYCIKTTNVYAGELGTKRFCAANDHGNYCRYIRQPTGDREYRSCVLTCSSENCNGASSLTLTTWIPLSIIVSSFIIYLTQHCNTLAQ